MELWKTIIPIILTVLGATWYLATTIQKNTDLETRDHEDIQRIESDSDEIKRRVTDIERTQRGMESNQTYMVDTDWNRRKHLLKK